MSEQPDLFGDSHSCKGDDREVGAKYLKEITERPFSRKVSYLKSRAKSKDIPFDLTERDLIELWTGVCPVFNTTLRKPYDRAGTPHPDPMSKHQPSLDRIDPAKGYVLGNVVWISMMANTIKQSASSLEVMAVANWMKGVEENVRDSSD